MCKRPLKGFRIPIFSSNKDPTNHFLKYEYKITSYAAHHIEKVNHVWQVSMNEWISPNCENKIDDFIEIPCGKCVECRLAHSRQWANRCMLELLDHDPAECWFLTLTYDDSHLCYSVNEDGLETNTLVPSDLQGFWKRLRSDLDYHKKLKNLRYFACGEYGTHTFRPHYHAIVYSLPLDDLEFWSKSKTGNPLFRSKYLESVWKQGIVTVSPVSWETCAYTARYVMKKADGYEKSYYTDLGLCPEYTVMSRRPGIAKNYFDKYKDKIYKFDEIVLDNGVKCKPPRYYDNLFEAADPNAYRVLKINRMETAQYAKEMKMSKTDLPYLDYLQVEEEKLKSKLKLLRRDL